MSETSHLTDVLYKVYNVHNTYIRKNKIVAFKMCNYKTLYDLVIKAYKVL
jgi:hypothetical protein